MAFYGLGKNMELFFNKCIATEITNLEPVSYSDCCRSKA